MNKVPRTVWALGFVSLCMDLSSELVHGLLPVFMTAVLGASMLAVGVVEGVAESTASIVRVFSGVLSDRLGRRKPLVVFGYGLAAASKPLFALAASVPLVLVARFMDRVGKGVRGAPRDALIADVTPAEVRGAAYGLRQALDTLGAVLGPLAAIGLMSLLASDIRAVLWVAVVRAILSVVVLVLFVREAPATRTGHAHALSRAVLGAKALGMALALVPIVLVVMNLAYSAIAYQAGLAADKGYRNHLLLWGLVALIAADLLIAAFASLAALFAGVVLWGAHMGLTQGLLSALVADTAPAPLRGTAFGVFHLVSGVALLAASVLAGWLWSEYGAAASFDAGAAFAAAALAGLVTYIYVSRTRP